MTEHNPMKAVLEELSGMQECWKLLGVMSREAERKAAEAEAHHDALLKLRGFLAGRIEELQQRLDALRAKAAAEEAPR